jgi:hypothetical protein
MSAAATYPMWRNAVTTLTLRPVTDSRCSTSTLMPSMDENATWLTSSGITGSTFPGMMLEPAWRAGRRSSPKPAWGLEDSILRSLQILDTLTAIL